MKNQFIDLKRELSEQDMIDSALKDGFESIYIHSIDSLSRKAV